MRTVTVMSRLTALALTVHTAHAYILSTPLGPHTRSGELFCWGYPDHRLGLGGEPLSARVGQLSLSPSGSTSMVFTPQSRLPVKLTSLSMRVSTGSADFSRTCGIAVDGSLWCFGDDGVPTVGIAAAPYRVAAGPYRAVMGHPLIVLALDTAGQLWDDFRGGTSPVATGVLDVDCTQSNTCCAVFSQQSAPSCGVLECWRMVTADPCAPGIPCGTSSSRLRLTSPPGVCFTNVSLASNGTAGAALSSTGSVYTWGQADSMGAGLASDPPPGTLAEVISLPEHSPAGQNKVRFTEISTAGERLAGLTIDGRLLHFGRNPESFDTGQIREEKRYSQVSGALSRGPYTCAVDTTGSAYCVGRMDRSTSFQSPQTFDQAMLHPDGKAWRAMYAGNNVFCGIDVDFDALCARLPFDTSPESCGVPGIPWDVLGSRPALSIPTMLWHNNTSLSSPGVVAVAARGDRTTAVLADGQGVATGPSSLGNKQASPLFTLSSLAVIPPGTMPRPGPVVDTGIFEYPCWTSTAGQLWCQANDRQDSTSVAIESVPPSAVTEWWLDSGTWPMPANGAAGTLASLLSPVWSHWQGGMVDIASPRIWRTYFEFCECGLSVAGEAVPGHSYFGPSQSAGLTAALGGPAARQSLRFTTMCRGEEHGCFLAEANGTLVCWGTDNSYGQVGGDAHVDGFVVVGAPASVTPPAVWTGWAKVACGARHTCAIDKEGELYCWGQGRYGALGRGPTDPFTDARTPTRVQRPSLPGAGAWIAVAAGDRHTCAILDVAIRPTPSVTPTITPSVTPSSAGSRLPQATPSTSRSTTPTATPSPSPSAAPAGFHGKIRINNLPAANAALPSARGAMIQIIESFLQLLPAARAVNITAVEDSSGAIVWPEGGTRPSTVRLLQGTTIWSSYYFHVLTGGSKEWGTNSSLSPALAASSLSDFFTGHRPVPSALASGPLTHWQLLAGQAQVPTASLSAAGPVQILAMTGGGVKGPVPPSVSPADSGATAAIVIVALIAASIAAVIFVPECRPVRAKVRKLLLPLPRPAPVRKCLLKPERGRSSGKRIPGPGVFGKKQPLFQMPDQRIDITGKHVGYGGTTSEDPKASVGSKKTVVSTPVSVQATTSGPGAVPEKDASTPSPAQPTKEVVAFNPLAIAAQPVQPPAAVLSPPPPPPALPPVPTPAAGLTGGDAAVMQAAEIHMLPDPQLTTLPAPPLPLPAAAIDEAPADFALEAQAAIFAPPPAQVALTDMTAAVLLVQRVIRGWRVRRRVSGWARIVDADGDIYWYHKGRQASSWYAPGYDPEDPWQTGV